MSVSGIQAGAESERRLRAPGSHQASLEDSLAEMVRLADSSGLLRTRSSSTSQAVSTPGQREVYEMNVSGVQASAESERRSRAPGSQQASLEDSLAELVRSSGLLRARSSSTSQALSMPGQADTEPPQPLGMAALQPLIDVAPDEPTGMGSVDIESPLASNAPAVGWAPPTDVGSKFADGGALPNEA
jgi:hypothetical protein